MISCDKCGKSVSIDDVLMLGNYWTQRYYCKGCHKTLIQLEYFKIMEGEGDKDV